MLINLKLDPGSQIPQAHAQPFLQREEQKASRRSIRDVAVHLMNSYVRSQKSYSQWQKHGAVKVQCFNENRDKDGNPKRHDWWSQPFSINAIEAMLNRTNSFDFNSLNLVDPRCNWLDGDIDLSIDGHVVGPNEPTALKICVTTNLGESFPLKPQLDREGWAFNSFQIITQERVLWLWNWLVTASSQFQMKEWFQNLRSLFSEIVSLVDMTLHQIYLKAQYDKLPAWKDFDREKLGSRIGRKLKDKLAWVGHITGRPLDDARQEIEALDVIRELRNHTQHFDPPCFCCTLEDVADWLNKLPFIGRLLWKIRDRIGSSLSVPLIEMLLLPSIKFVPKPFFGNRRIPQGDDSGYASTRWKENTENPIKEQLVSLKLEDAVLEAIDKEAAKRRGSTNPASKFSRADLIREILRKHTESLLSAT